jgi:hypothetical protein
VCGETGRGGVERRRHENDAHLNAPAAALGPNHMPTSFPAALPASAMRCTPNGAAGASRNHERSRACRACAARERGGKGTGGVGWRGGSKRQRDVSTECEQRERDGKTEKAESDGSSRRAGVEILPQTPAAVPHPPTSPKRKRVRARKSSKNG